MLAISETTMAAFEADGLRTLRQRILAGWHERLRAAGDRVGEEGRARVLGEIEATARDDRSLTVADLEMLADLMLVDADARLYGLARGQSIAG